MYTQSEQPKPVNRQPYPKSEPEPIYRVQNENGLGVVYHHLERHSFTNEDEPLPEWAINFKAPPHEVFYPATKLGITRWFEEPQPNVKCWFTRQGYEQRVRQINEHLAKHPELKLIRATLLTKPRYQDKVQVVF